MKPTLVLGAMALAFAACTPIAASAPNDRDGTTIVDAAVATPELSTLTTAVKAAGLARTLSSDGPFTVFAPVNGAFAKLPGSTVETLLMPRNRAALANVLTYHVIPRRLSSRALLSLVRAHRGRARLHTVQGEALTVSRGFGGALVLTDAKGGRSLITAADLDQSNGVVHLIDSVVLPKA